MLMCIKLQTFYYETNACASQLKKKKKKKEKHSYKKPCKLKPYFLVDKA